MSSVTKSTSDQTNSLSHADVTERRWMRFPADEARVNLRLCDGRELEASVRDESFGGIAVSLSNPPFELTPGCELEIEYAGAPMAATVRRVLALADGQTLIGLEWT
jgi:hypothetical protein